MNTDSGDVEKGHKTKQSIKIDNLGPNNNFRRKSLKIAHLYLSSASLRRRPTTVDIGEQFEEKPSTTLDESHASRE